MSPIEDVLCFNLSATSLPRMNGFFGTCDAFVVISRIQEDSSILPVWKSVVIKSNLNPLWKNISIPLQRLCNGDITQALRLELFDWDPSLTHESIGSTDISVDDLIQSSDRDIAIINPAKEISSSRYENSGVLHFSSVQVERHPTFPSFINGGCTIKVLVGIDFTNVNGDPSLPGSLHHWDSSGRGLNPYQQTIQTVGAILEQYDTDKLFPVYGFGAKVRDSKSGVFSATQHWFSLSHSEESRGVSGVLDCYRQAMPTLKFDGPPLLHPLLQYTVEHTLNTPESICTQEHQVYTILLLITSGGIGDLEATIHSLVQAKDAPLSVIIVGVGDGSFEGNVSFSVLSVSHFALHIRDEYSGWGSEPTQIWTEHWPRHCSIRQVLQKTNK
jgi:hypothetical protein